MILGIFGSSNLVVEPIYFESCIRHMGINTTDIKKIVVSGEGKFSKNVIENYCSTFKTPFDHMNPQLSKITYSNAEEAVELVDLAIVLWDGNGLNTPFYIANLKDRSIPFLEIIMRSPTKTSIANMRKKYE